MVMKCFNCGGEIEYRRVNDDLIIVVPCHTCLKHANRDGFLYGYSASKDLNDNTKIIKNFA